MPEAAEVSVAVAQLRRVAVGRVVRSVTVTHPRTIRSSSPAAIAAFGGQVVVDVHRHGKWLVLVTDGGEALGVHLRMSGQLLARLPGDEPPDRHVHAQLAFGERAGPTPPEAGSRCVPLLAAPTPPSGAAGVDGAPVTVWFRDPRTFGELRPLSSGAPVAPDLFDAQVDADRLWADARRRKVGVKAVLLDQARTMSGIGSYLADETLHRAGISPLRPAESLAASAWERMLATARELTTESAAAGGVTLPDEGWVDLWGRPGGYARHLRIHGRATCATCGTATRRAVVGGRSARWCPRCQDARRRR